MEKRECMALNQVNQQQFIFFLPHTHTDRKTHTGAAVARCLELKKGTCFLLVTDHQPLG